MSIRHTTLFLLFTRLALLAVVGILGRVETNVFRWPTVGMYERICYGYPPFWIEYDHNFGASPDDDIWKLAGINPALPLAALLLAWTAPAVVAAFMARRQRSAESDEPAVVGKWTGIACGAGVGGLVAAVFWCALTWGSNFGNAADWTGGEGPGFDLLQPLRKGLLQVINVYDWRVYFAVTAAGLAAGALLGYLLARRRPTIPSA